MKNIVIILTVFLFANIGFSQAPPQGINYQAVVYSDNGNNQPGLNVPGQLLLNQAIRVRFTILANAANGTEVYKESHATTTDAFGMFSLIIGQGAQESSNSFAVIDWGTGKHFLKVEIDKSGGTNYITMSNQQLWSVPYALYSQHAATADSSTTSANATTADFATNSAHADSSGYASQAGNGITGVTDNGNGTLTFTYLDGSSYTTGVLSGLTGPQGPAGVNGQSAYDIWLSQGNTGTQQDFLNSLQGPQGTPGSQNAWSLTGNAGTNPTTNFIGTTDAQDWAIKTNNTERMRVTSAGNVGIGTSSPISKMDIKGGYISIGTPNSAAFLLNVYDENNLMRIRSNMNYTSLYTEFDFDVLSPNNSSNSYIRFFRHLNTTGDKSVKFLKGNGTTDVSALIAVDGGNSFFQNHGGNFGIGTPNPIGKFHVNNDVSGADSSFVVTTGGNVGIGTSSPIFRLTSLDDPLGLIKPFGIVDNANNQRFRIDIEGDNTINYTNVRFEALSLGNTDGVEYRFFRTTNTTGPKAVVFFRGNNTTQGSAQIGVDGAASYFQLQGGNFGIGTFSPDQLLSVNGNASKAGGGSWATFSDKRVKHDINQFNDGLDVLMKLTPVTFKYNEKSGYSDVNKTFVGFIAQDVENIAPYMVNVYDDSNGPSGLSDKRQFDESALNKILVNAVQEQQAQIEQLKKELEEMKLIVKELKKN
jgi:hypothetical protein